MRRTALRGHALRSEGAAFIPAASCDGHPDAIAPDGTAYTRCQGHIGYGLCECGELSPSLHSGAGRRRWHADHKNEIRAKGSDTDGN